MEYYLPIGYGSARLVFTGAALDNAASFTIHLAVLEMSSLAVATAVGETFVDTVMLDGAAVSDAYNFAEVQVALTTLGPDPIIETAVMDVGGTSASPCLPPNCSLLVTKTTGLGGRRNRGRIYAPAGFLAEDQVSNAGLLPVATTDILDGRWEAWRVALEALGPSIVLAHQWDPADVAAPVLPTGSVRFHVEQRIATQRRRLR